MGGGHSQNVRSDLAISLSEAPCFENAPHPMALPCTEYLQLIGDLIKRPEDVKLLTDFGVIKKSSGSSQNTFEMWNRLTRVNKPYPSGGENQEIVCIQT